MTIEYRYFARQRPEDTMDRPSALWRQAGDNWEYLSLLDWQWHPRGDRPLPPSGSLAPVSNEHAMMLLGDRQRFVRYWARYRTATPGPEDRPITVYRRRNSPERQIDEAFGRGDTWIPTRTVRDFEFSGTSDPAHLVPIDPDEAEHVIREIAGVSGATEL